jgi:hypothetical protein
MQMTKQFVTNCLNEKPLADESREVPDEELKPILIHNIPLTDGRIQYHGVKLGRLISLYAICEYPDIFGLRCLQHTGHDQLI